MSEPRYRTTRAVTRKECHWLDKTVPKGAVVYAYWGCTYGCVGPGIAVTRKRAVEPFFEMPRDALELAP